MKPESLSKFQVSTSGSRIHWDDGDVDLNAESIRAMADPQVRQQQETLRRQEAARYAQAIRGLREERGLRQADIEGLTSRQVRRCRALGVQPTSAHRRGERKGPRSPAYRKGAWLLTEEGHEAEHVAPVIERLLRQLPEAPAVWNELRTQHDVQLRFGLHMSGWNKGLVIPRELVDRMASVGATLDFDIYTCHRERGST